MTKLNIAEGKMRALHAQTVRMDRALDRLDNSFNALTAALANGSTLKVSRADIRYANARDKVIMCNDKMRDMVVDLLPRHF